MRKWLLAAGAAAVIGGPTALAFFSGGYFDRPRLIAALAVWALVAVVGLAAPRPVPNSTPARVALAALLLLCVWTAASVAWAPIGGRAVDDLQRLLLYLGFFVCALALLRVPGARRWLEPVVALGALVAVCFALSERLLPELGDLDRSMSATGRLEQPLSYWNALGLFAAMGLVLTIHIAGDLARERALRAAAAAAGVALGLGVYLTFARGALVALAVGVVVLLALAPAVRPLLRSLAAIGGASGLAAIAATRFPTVKSLDVGERADAGDGAVMLAILVVLALAAAAFVAVEPRRRLRLPSLPFSRPAVVLTAAGVVLLAAVVAIAVFEGRPEGTSPARGADPARLASIDTNRYRYWDVALETWADHPIAGIGSGGFLAEWLKERDRVDTSGDAHSLYVETLAELGVIGFALLLAFLAAVVAGVVRLYRLAPELVAGPAAVMATFAVHAGLDWDWEMPALGLTALLMAAATLAWSEEAVQGRSDAAPAATPSARNPRMPTTLRALVLTLVLALAVAPSALAQSAGDDQYVDPFQQEAGGDGGGNGDTSTGQDDESAQAPADTTTDVTGGDTAGESASDGEGTALPQTGLMLGGLVVGGAILFAGGAALRRRASGHER